MFSSSASQVVSATQAEAVDFDGTNDYLSRSSDLTGNADGKTFTFSAWVWNSSSGFIYSSGFTGGLNIQLSGTSLFVYAYPVGSGTPCLDASVSSSIPVNTFVHILVSIDLTNTSNRYIYINDVQQSPTWTTYSNTTIDFTKSIHAVGASDSGGNKEKGRPAHVYLDYTYRDLSVTNNRRLFVTADLKPASGQAALNPILYLPMSDPTTVATNAGTGGNFTLNGTIARSGRGPNQYNAPYSDLDGAADYLSRTTAPTGIADSGTFTLSFNWRPSGSGTNDNTLIAFATSTTSRFYVRAGAVVAGQWTLTVVGNSSAGTQILNLSHNGNTIFYGGRNYLVTISVDLSNTSKRHVYVNGASTSNQLWVTYTNSTINFSISATPRYYIGTNASTLEYVNANIGAFWFNTSYIDLSVASNLAKFVTGTGIDAKPVDLGASGELPTGTSPIIYLPMYGNNAGKNYGTGGDFTVNSGPYTGARGPNEFWGNRADFNGTTGYLSRTSALSGVNNGKAFTLSFWANVDSFSGQGPVPLTISTGTAGRLTVHLSSTQTAVVQARNAANTLILSATGGTSLSTGVTYHFLISIDLENTGNRRVYIDGVNQSYTWSIYTNDTIELSASRVTQGCWFDYTSPTDGRFSELYFVPQYIDFSQEANRLLFRDAFGNPTDLPAAIAAQSIPNPAIYMRFDPASFGTNSGTGGNFTVNGTITDGGQL